jgi:hypothetical protein
VEPNPVPVRPSDQPCLRCGVPASYFRVPNTIWRGSGVVRRADGAVVPLDPRQAIPLCVECAAEFDPRSRIPWNAPLWVVPLPPAADPSTLVEHP